MCHKLKLEHYTVAMKLTTLQNQEILHLIGWCEESRITIVIILIEFQDSELNKQIQRFAEINLKCSLKFLKFKKMY